MDCCLMLMTFLGLTEDDDIIRVRAVDDFILMQDNALCHRSAEVVEFLAEEEIKVMSWLAQSHLECLANPHGQVPPALH